MAAPATSLNGLSVAEAAARLERDGPNELAARRRTLLGVIGAQLRSPLLRLLAAAAAVSIAVGKHTDGVIILGIIVASVGLGVFNEFRSEQTLESLRERTGRRATVVRDDATTEVPASQLVVGDLCILQTGDIVPADLELVETNELTVDEATLTGEAFPAEKRPGSGDEGRAFMGTIVQSGGSSGVVVATAGRTRIGGVAAGVQQRLAPTAFQRGLTGFTALLAKVTALLTVSIFVANGALGRPVLDALLFSLAIAVGLTPQLLPAIVTVSLATGARRMARASVLVKRLVSIEDLGDADILFTDKTGTLTEGEIRLRDAVLPDGSPAHGLVRLGLLASELHREHGGEPLGNPLDLAIWRSFQPGVAAAELDGADRVAVLPFSSSGGGRRTWSVRPADAG